MQGGVSMSSRNCVIIQREKRVVGWAAAPRDYAWYIKSYSSQVIIWWMRWHLWLIFSFFPCVCPTFIHARWSGWCPVTLSPQTMGWWDYRTPEKKNGTKQEWWWTVLRRKKIASLRSLTLNATPARILQLRQSQSTVRSNELAGVH